MRLTSNTEALSSRSERLPRNGRLNRSILWQGGVSLRTSFSVFYVDIARDVVMGLLISAKYLFLYLYIFTCTYRGTNTQAHRYNQHTGGMVIQDTGAWLRGAEEKLLLETKALHTHKKGGGEMSENSDIHKS